MKLAILLTALTLTVETALPQCTVGQNQPGPEYLPPPYQTYPNAWLAGSTVPYIMFEAEFCDPSNNCYFTYWPSNLWNDYVTSMSAYAGLGSVYFSFYGTSGSPEPEQPSLKAILVNPSDIDNGATGETFSGYWKYGSTWALGAVTHYFRNDITVDHFMQFVSAHEFGHTFALADCYSCQANTTVMVSGFNVPSFNSPTGGLTPRLATFPRLMLRLTHSSAPGGGAERAG